MKKEISLGLGMAAIMAEGIMPHDNIIPRPTSQIHRSGVMMPAKQWKNRRKRLAMAKASRKVNR